MFQGKKLVAVSGRLTLRIQKPEFRIQKVFIEKFMHA
jgi:hypothetical protein